MDFIKIFNQNTISKRGDIVEIKKSLAIRAKYLVQELPSITVSEYKIYNNTCTETAY